MRTELNEDQYNDLKVYDDLLTRLSSGRRLYGDDRNIPDIFLRIYSDIYSAKNVGVFKPPKNTCRSCGGSTQWAKRLGRWYVAYKKINRL